MRQNLLHMTMFFLEFMNDSILVLVDSNEQRFTKLNGNISVIQSVITGMETEFTDIWSKVWFFSMYLTDTLSFYVYIICPK